MKCINRFINNLKNVYKICFTKDWIFMRKYVYEYYVKSHPTFKNIIEEQEKQIKLLEDVKTILENKVDVNLTACKIMAKTIDSLTGELIMCGFDDESIVEMLPGLTYNDKKDLYNSILKCNEIIRNDE